MKPIRTIQDILLWKKQELTEIRGRIQQAIFESDAHDTMRSILMDTTDNSGKMLRPMTILLAAGDYAPEKREELYWGAAAGEMLHTASLLLDDIIDEADTRRGKPSVQARFGKSVALCAGDFLMAISYGSLLSRGFYDLAASLIKVTQRVCDGEMLQDENQWNVGTTVDDYLHAIEGKTASVFSFCCREAARITGRDKEIQEIMEEFGLTIGLLFQIRDDVLDWIKDERILGKPAGEDFQHGIYTLPALYAFQVEEVREKLLTLAMKRDGLAAEEIREVRRLVEESGGIAYAGKRIGELSNRALALLDRLPDSRYIKVFRTLVQALAPV